MNHRKLEHPSNKRCRHFRKGECIFDSETCWYRHGTREEVNTEEFESSKGCNECGYKSAQKSSMMTHMKKEHSQLVPKCRKFLQGNCELSNEFCCFVHELN